MFSHCQWRKKSYNVSKSRTFNLSINEDGRATERFLKSNNENVSYMERFKSDLFKDSRDLSPIPDARSSAISEEVQEEYKKIESPLLVLKDKVQVLSELHNIVSNHEEEFKELRAIQFNFLVSISKLINIIFKSLSLQVLNKKVKTRSHLLPEYLESDNFKRLVVYVETHKKSYEEMMKTCSRKIFDLKLHSDKEKDEVLEYYNEVFTEVEEQVLVGKIVDIANQMLYQMKFNSQVYIEGLRHRELIIVALRAVIWVIIAKNILRDCWLFLEMM